MDRDIIAHIIDVLDADHMVDAAGQMPRGVNRDIGVVAVDLHTQIDRCVGDLYADGAQSDDAELFALQLRTGKSLLLFLGDLCDVLVVPVGAHPVDTFHDVTGGQEHTGKDKLLDAVSVGTGSIEHDDTLLRALVNRDIVDTCARAGDRKGLVGEFHSVHGSTSDQNSVCLLYVVGELVLIGEFAQSLFRDIVETDVFKHSTFFFLPDDLLSVIFCQ